MNADILQHKFFKGFTYKWMIAQHVFAIKTMSMDQSSIRQHPLIVECTEGAAFYALFSSVNIPAFYNPINNQHMEWMKGQHLRRSRRKLCRFLVFALVKQILEFGHYQGISTWKICTLHIITSDGARLAQILSTGSGCISYSFAMIFVL